MKWNEQQITKSTKYDQNNKEPARITNFLARWIMLELEQRRMGNQRRVELHLFFCYPAQCSQTDKIGARLRTSRNEFLFSCVARSSNAGCAFVAADRNN